MKIFFRNIHLYLGLAAGLFISIACITGAILVFEEECQHLFHHERYFTLKKGETMPLAELKSKLSVELGKGKIGSVRIHADPLRNYEFNVMIPDQKRNGQDGNTKQRDIKAKPNERGTRLTAFVDPYSGQLVELYNHRESFFYFVMDLHRWLLAKDTGKLIMGISTLIFLVILITGIILWWPRTAKILRQRLNVKWTGGWKRLNHDLHIVLGFYASILLFIFSFTALAWSFQWFNDGIFAITNTPKERTPPPQSIKLGTRSADIDSIYNHCHRLAGDFEYMNVGFPSDSAGMYSITVLPANASHESATDNYYYDQFTGELKKKIRYTEKPLGQRVRASFRPIHTSSIAGLPGKIIGFIICILGFTFPITGTILWINRLRKQRK